MPLEHPSSLLATARQEHLPRVCVGFQLLTLSWLRQLCSVSVSPQDRLAGAHLSAGRNFHRQCLMRQKPVHLNRAAYFSVMIMAVGQHSDHPG